MLLPTVQKPLVVVSNVSKQHTGKAERQSLIKTRKAEVKDISFCIRRGASPSFFTDKENSGVYSSRTIIIGSSCCDMLNVASQVKFWDCWVQMVLGRAPSCTCCQETLNPQQDRYSLRNWAHYSPPPALPSSHRLFF